MKEEICERILLNIEYDKWNKILMKEVETNPIFKQFEIKTKKEWDGGGHKSEITVKISLSTVYTDKCEWSKRINKVKLHGWFSGYTTNEYWEEEYYEVANHTNLFSINCTEKNITIYDKRLYNYCKKFGKRYKFKKLIKCWEDVE